MTKPETAPEIPNPPAKVTAQALLRSSQVQGFT
jgi:hypothetical protein